MRPETLFPLFSPIQSLDGVGPKSAQLFQKISVDCARDMAFHLPSSGVDRRLTEDLRDVSFPAIVTIEIVITGHYPSQRRGGVYRVQARSHDIPVQILYFRPMPSDFSKRVRVDETYWISGRAEWSDQGVTISHPDYLEPKARRDRIPEFEVIYPATAGLGQALLRRAAGQSVVRAPDLDEWINPGLFKKEGWPDWKSALVAVHTPSCLEDLSPMASARRRLAYDELLAHQLTLALARCARKDKPGRATKGDHALSDLVLRGLPYSMTDAQRRCVSDILADMASPNRMMRLLQGDVGSGKTLVALLAMIAAVESGGQAVLMAPTEILARQHLVSIKDVLGTVNLRVEVLTGRDKSAERKRILSDLESGAIDILVGTHAVFQESVKYCDLRLAVIDEQHRFGVRERMQLSQKGVATDVLVMTATPIPRSLALTHYGDMDVSILDEKPMGRQPIQSAVVSLDRLPDVVARLRAAIAEGRQVYWVCPLVEESEVVDLAAAEQRFEHLRAELGEGTVDLVHGRMPAADKDRAMERLQQNACKVLVATTVIEVGVNVPNASIMVIERAESFGLSQLHQLRGRVGRGDVASTCVFLYKPPLSQAGQKRLSTIRDTEDGFKLSEVDLQMRGAGDVLGVAQSGLPRFQVADLETQGDLMLAARHDAEVLLTEDPGLTSRRGMAARTLLWLMRHDEAMQRMRIG